LPGLAVESTNCPGVALKKIALALVLIVSLLGAFVYVTNANFGPPRSGKPLLLAHRAVAQRFDAANVQRDTCTATLIEPPTHAFLENTLASMQAAFAFGADIVELDVHPTTDGQFAVFHDWTLDCRTDGHGVTREHAMAELKRLDIGYGYTADGGRTYPFRGQGVALMPSLDEVLRTFPDRSFLINIKSNDPDEGRKLAEALRPVAPERRRSLMAYGGDRSIEELRRNLPDLKVMSRGSLKSCLLRYIASGWTGMTPEACRRMVVLVPINIAPWLWGWPDRFLDRMVAADSAVFVIGAYRGGDFSSGIDTPEDMAGLPSGFTGGVLTNEIEWAGKALRKEQAPPSSSR
jgi:glycerophosphoryl diester phosphodiesterase